MREHTHKVPGIAHSGGLQLQPCCRECGDASDRLVVDNLCHDCAARTRARRVPCLAQRVAGRLPLFGEPSIEVPHAEPIQRRRPGPSERMTRSRERRERLAAYLVRGGSLRSPEIRQLLGFPQSSVFNVVQSDWFALVDRHPCRWALSDAGRAAMETAAAG